MTIGLIRKGAAIVTALCLMLALACPAALGDGDDYLGTWVSGRAELVITPNETEGYDCVIHWGSSATEMSEWTYTGCFYDEVSEGLNSFENGVRRDYTLSKEGEEESFVEVFTDGAASFMIDEDGDLSWTDFKVYPDEEPVLFTRVELTDALESAVPSPDAFAGEFFRMIGGADASDEAQLALAAARAVLFAVEHEMWAPDVEATRANMLEAWNGLTDDERAAFDGNFMEVTRRIDAAIEDWEGNSAAFIAADELAEEFFPSELMELLGLEDQYAEAWKNLCAYTLTMGNSEE